MAIGKVAAHVHRCLDHRHLRSWERRNTTVMRLLINNIIPIGCFSYDTSIASAPQASCVARHLWCAIQDFFPKPSRSLDDDCSQAY